MLNRADEQFEAVVFRPATVCGYSQTEIGSFYNILTNHAVNKNKITVFGGDQLRPNLHISDYVALCALLLEAPVTKLMGKFSIVAFKTCQSEKMLRLLSVRSTYF